MALSVNQKRKLKQTKVLLIAGALLGPLYVLFSDGFKELHPYISSVVAGILIAIVVALLEIWWLDKGIKYIRFIYLVFLRTLIYLTMVTLIVTNVLIVSRMIRLDQSYLEVLQSEDWLNYVRNEDYIIVLIYALSFALLINFTRMLSRKMGQGMLLSHINGTYFTPQIQERIVLFMNISNSKAISEKLGPMNFHRFLNEVFFDITEPIIYHRGIISEYVEDLIVVTWAMDKGISNANCLRTYFEIKDKIKGAKEKYFSKFGLFPNLKAALHCGKVVRAEIGDVKTQIVFHGDTMNTTSRILDKCHELNKDILTSANLIYRIDLPKILESQSVGSISLKGKEKEIELFDIIEKEVVTM